MSPDDELTADSIRSQAVDFFRANGASEAFILRLLLSPPLKTPPHERVIDDLLMEYNQDWLAVPNEELERCGLTRGQLYARIIDTGGHRQVTYAKIVSFPVPKEPRPMLAPVVHIQTASGVRRMVPRSRRRRTTATRRGPPSQGDPSPEPKPPLDLLDAAVLVLGWERV
jgi:hypothetical protein